jgi:hypothetical protein
VAVSIGQKPACLFTKSSEKMNQFSNMPDDPNAENWEVGFVDGQLLPHGGSRELIEAVSTKDSEEIFKLLADIPDREQRDRLTRICMRLIPAMYEPR